MTNFWTIFLSITLAVVPSTIYTWHRYKQDRIEDKKEQSKQIQKHDSLMLHNMKNEYKIMKLENQLLIKSLIKDENPRLYINDSIN